MPVLTPPKFVQMLRDRDRRDLVAALQALADSWDNALETIDGEATRRKCARELRAALEQN